MKIQPVAFWQSLKDKLYPLYILYGNNGGMIEGLIEGVKRIHGALSLDINLWLENSYAYTTPSLFTPAPHVIILEGKFSIDYKKSMVPGTTFLVQQKTILPSWITDTNIGVIPCFRLTPAEHKKIFQLCLNYKGLVLAPCAIERACKAAWHGRWFSVIDQLAMCALSAQSGTSERPLVEADMHIFHDYSDTFFPPVFLCTPLHIDNLAETEYIPTIKQWQRVFLQLYHLLRYESEGMIISDVVKKITPPISFHDVSLFTQYAPYWSLTTVMQALIALWEQEKIVKRDKLLAPSSMKYFLQAHVTPAIKRSTVS